LSGSLQDRTAIITGAASGIGRATAILFGREGASLMLVDRDRDGLQQTAEGLRRDGVRFATRVANVADADAASSVTEEAGSTFPSIDILVNNAGIAFMGDVVETTPEDWDTVFAINVKSVYLFSRAAIPHMQRKQRGSIVNTASEAGLVGFQRYAAYAASKAAVVNLTRSMALDCAPFKIRVNCVCPGSIETPLLERYYAAQPDPPAARRVDVEVHPLGLGRPEDVADAILYLASDRSAYVTGHALAVDGGYTSR
jgi:NAD(P)-dependent dehydrogenase (short-subunit alcohol dehydrogenase family)